MRTVTRFHPEQPNAMMSGSTDGYAKRYESLTTPQPIVTPSYSLVCLYNLETFDEDDALYQVIKEESVHKIGYFGPSYEYLYCLTHMETFSLWQFSEVCHCRKPCYSAHCTMLTMVIAVGGKGLPIRRYPNANSGD